MSQTTRIADNYQRLQMNEIPINEMARTIEIVGSYTKDLYGDQREYALQAIAYGLSEGFEIHSVCRLARKEARGIQQSPPPGVSDPSNWFKGGPRAKPATLEEATQLARRSAIQW